MTTKTLTLSFIATSLLLSTSTVAEEVTLDDITVTSDFRKVKLLNTTSSITVIGEDELYDKAADDFMELLSKAPNVNFSSGASRGKYFQIRGLGEKGQFETPLNPTVGLLVDGIDFSNATLGATLFDTKQIEIFRGPQGTAFGANALGGIVTVATNDPTKETEGHVEATLGNYNTKAMGVAVGGTLVEDTLLGRFSLYKKTSDGFYENTYLNRKDTNNIDELSSTAKLRWLASDNHTVDMTFIHLDVDNGYDVFNEDNDFTTESDQPGKDTQKTDAISLKSTYYANDLYMLETKATYNKTKSEYSYDEDWTYTGAYYTSFDQYLRKKKQADVDVRLLSGKEGKIFSNTTDWVLGAYYKTYNSDLTRNNTYFAAPFISSYDAKSVALYGQMDTELNDKLKLISGLRVERWRTDYEDSDDVTYNGDKTLVGGKLGLSYDYSATQNFYVMLSRGYKPNGFNPVTDASGLPKVYETETLWNLDIGSKGVYLNGKLTGNFNLFYGQRRDQQVGTSYVTEGYKYTDYITNADKSHYYGAEVEFAYRMTDTLTFNGGLGLLRSEFDSFYNPVDDESKDGRAPAQSPRYQYNLGLAYHVMDDLTFKTNMEGKGSYYFSNSHDKKSKAYTLVNASLEYSAENWSVTLWGKNLTDERYATRGYYFDNFGTGADLYTQQGSPRTFGLTISYDF